MLGGEQQHQDHSSRSRRSARATSLSELGSGRFAVRRRLGAGGMGVVYEAYDSQLQSVVALKVLNSKHAASLVRFKREFRALADVLHPNLISLYDLVADDKRWLFTMELVSGTDLMSYVRGDDGQTAPETPWSNDVTRTVETNAVDVSLTPATNEGTSLNQPVEARDPISTPEQYARLRSSFAQLCDGVEAIHGYGYLHCDLKPSNVLVEPGGRAVVLDFGIITEIAGNHEKGSVVGTAAYLAPEVAAGKGANEASDWYGLGVMLYEALVGVRPFVGSSKTVMTEKCGIPARPCRERNPAIPAELAELCDSLLSIEPSDRPQAADIKAVFASDARSALATPARAVFTPRFVGRENERLRLEKALQQTRQDREPRCVRVHGISGMGKSALVDAFLAASTDEGALVLSGRCRPHEVVPYKALDGLVDSLADALIDISEDAVAAVLPRDVRSAARLFPVLETVPGIAAAPAPEVRLGESAVDQRRRGFIALHRLFGNLSMYRPLVLHIDDVQWGDRDSARALAVGLANEVNSGVLLLVSYRTDEAEASDFLRALRSLSVATDEIEVGPLARDAALKLASSCLRAHGGSAKLAADIVDEAEGSPLLVAELAAAVANRAPLLGSRERSSDLVADLVARRVAALPEEARRLMDVLTVAGTRVDRRVALVAAGIESGSRRTMKALTAARLARRWQTPQLDALETYHDRIREAHAKALSPEFARDRHRDLATTLEKLEPEGVEALAVHWEAAGDTTRAARYYELAGDRARDAPAFERATAHYEHSLTLESREGSARAELLAKLGSAFSDGGDGPRAATAFGEAAACAEPAHARRLRGKQAEELLRAGQIEMGLERLREVLREVGEPLPVSQAGMLASIAYQRLRIALRGLRLADGDGEIAEETHERLELYRKSLTSLAWVDPLLAVAVQCRYLRVALDIGDPHHAAVALSAEANFQALAGPRSNAKTTVLCEKSDEQAERAGDDLARFYSTYADGFRRFHCGDFEGGRSQFMVAGRRGAAVTGAHWEQLKCDEGALWCDFFLGAFARLSSRVAELYASASARSDLPSLMTLCTGLPSTAWLVRDEPAAGREAAADVLKLWTNRGYHLVHYWELFAEAQVDLYTGDAAAAHERMSAGWPALKGSGLLRILGIAREALHTRARAAIAAAAAREPADRPGLLKVAHKATRRLARDPTPLAAGMVHAHRAAIAHLQGQDDDAVAGLRAAMAQFEDHGIAGYGAAARRHLGSLLGGDEGAKLVATADRWMTGETVARPEPFAHMLLPGFDR